jgi:transcriptional regulator with XRE-family HTH domain
MSTPTPLALLGPRLRQARQKVLLTVREAADQIGVKHSIIVRYEQGQVAPPLDRLLALAQLYQVSPAGLLVIDDALLPIVTLLEQATPAQLKVFAQQFQQAIEQAEQEQ